MVSGKRQKIYACLKKFPPCNIVKNLRRIGRKGFTTIKNIETDVCLRVPIIELDKYNKDIWKNPSAIKQATSTCIYCGKVSVNGNIKRWHNENCKNRSSR
jgi:hypothetical protein